ncbi:MAG: glycosyltransferase family 4 protein [Candidatus Nanoarchaeia archaeon]
MRIAQTVRHYTKTMGVSRVVAELCENFLKMGHEVHVYATSRDKNTPKEIKFHWVPTFRINLPYEVSSFNYMSSYMLKKNADKYDIIHSHGDTNFNDVYSCHGYVVDPSLKINPSSGKPFTSLDRYIIKKMDGYVFGGKNFKKIIAVSNFVKKRIQMFYQIDDKDITVIHNGVNIEEFSGDRQKMGIEIRKTYNIPPDKILLLFVSKDHRLKGLENIINSLKFVKNKNVKLLVVGKDREGERIHKIFKKQAERENVSDMITFTGDTLKTRDFFLGSDIFVYPTKTDPCALVILEAMASGLPIITSSPSINGMAEIISDGKDGLILKDHLDPKELAQKIDLLIENHILRKTIGDEASKKAKDYSWDKVAKRTLEVYQEVINKK